MKYKGRIEDFPISNERCAKLSIWSGVPSKSESIVQEVEVEAFLELNEFVGHGVGSTDPGLSTKNPTGASLQLDDPGSS